MCSMSLKPRSLCCLHVLCHMSNCPVQPVVTVEQNCPQELHQLKIMFELGTYTHAVEELMVTMCFVNDCL